MTMMPLRFATIFVMGILLMATSACGTSVLDEHEMFPTSFDAYRHEAIQRIGKHRIFQTNDHLAELNWNAPREWRPKGHPQKVFCLFMDSVTRLLASMTSVHT